MSRQFLHGVQKLCTLESEAFRIRANKKGITTRLGKFWSNPNSPRLGFQETQQPVTCGYAWLPRSPFPAN
jgi:hypothetical protein